MVMIPVIESDMGEVGSARHLEIPIQGPGSANLLVCINGITLRGLDIFADGDNEENSVSVSIDTDYKLRDDDVLIDRSAYACLASFGVDGSNRSFELALDEAAVNVRTTKVIQLRLSGSVAGDTALYRIGYQVNLVVLRTH